MSKLLILNSSFMGENSVSRKLTATFAEKFLQSNPGTERIDVDISALELPHLGGEIIGSFFTPAEQRNEVQGAHVQRSDDLIAQFKEADVVVIGAPMYNFGIPSTLKSYIDHILRAGETFKYTEEGPVGLLEDKPVYIIATRGGDYSENGFPHMDFVLPYLKTVLGFIGITNVIEVQANGQALGDEAAAAGVDAATTEIEKVLAA